MLIHSFIKAVCLVTAAAVDRTGMTMIAVIGRAGRIIYEVVLDVLNMPASAT